ncbi:MAG: hypothetical protein ACT4QF_14945 [Sporichthyaceae bacterium]
MNARRLAPIALAAGLVLAGCGGDSDEAVAGPSDPPTPVPQRLELLGPTALPRSSTSASPSPTGSPTASATAVPTASPDGASAARRLASAGVLLATDLPGAKRIAQTRDASARLVERTLSDCLDAAPLDYRARDYGHVYTEDGVDVSSSSRVARTREQARSELNLLRGANGPRCFRDAFLEIAPDGVELDVDAVDVEVAGADRAVAYRIVATFEGDDESDESFSTGYALVALVDRTEVWLDTSESRQTARFGLTRLAALAEKLVARVKAAG